MKIHHKSIAPPRIEMLPLIDIVFLLLVFFIYAMLSMAVHYGQPVDLPASESAALEPQEAVSITMQVAAGDIQLFVDEEPVSLESLSEHLQGVREKRPDGQKIEVQIFADKTVSYQQLFQVLDRVKEAGLTRISLQAEPDTGGP
ncbi:MAG: biopolymer transporter ExbD [Desulfobulbaceae bacterium]|nr:biopolymer transporter ExbD [Desulfobulbaceae bacterium]